MKIYGNRLITFYDESQEERAGLAVFWVQLVVMSTVTYL